MMGPTHVAIGTATAMGACALTSPRPVDGAILVGAALASSKLPDQLEVVGLRHRGPTHWLVVALAVVGLVTLAAAMVVQSRPYTDVIGAGVAIGYVMHIAADMCTVSGVECLGPFSRRDRWLLPRGMRFVTGKAGDGLVAFAATAASIGFAWLLLPPSLG